MRFAGFEFTRAASGVEAEVRRFIETNQFADDPRRVERGTSYDAKGTVVPEANAYSELGSAMGGRVRDIVPELSNRTMALQVYDRMANNDTSVDVSLRAAKIPVQGADYFIEAYDGSDEAKVIANFVQFNLLSGMSQPFLLVLEDILRFYEYGHSILESVWELREWAPDEKGANRRKYTMLRKLAARPANTIKEFKYDDNGGPEAIVQNAIRADGKPQEVTIEIDKLIIFSFNKKGNLEGKSLLRTAYKHWYYADNLEKIDAIQKERHAIGIPKAILEPGHNQKDIDAAWKLVTELRTNEKAGIVETPGFSIDFAKVEGQLVDVLKSIEYHRSMVMLNVMVQFLLLGIIGGGGRATSGSHQDMFEKSLKYVANLICEYFNLYLIPKLVGYNFDTDKFPKLAVRNVGEARVTQQWASALANLAAQNLITLDLETEQWVRKIIDAPFKLGDKQTPEANATSGSDNNKGGVQTEGETDPSGNIEKGNDPPN